MGIVGMIELFVIQPFSSFATSSLSDSIKQSQNQLQSAINSQVQSSITDTIEGINNKSKSSSNGTAYIGNSTKDNILSPMSNISSDKVLQGGIDTLQSIPQIII